MILMYASIEQPYTYDQAWSQATELEIFTYQFSHTQFDLVTQIVEP